MTDSFTTLLELLEENRNIKFTGNQLPIYQNRLTQWLKRNQTTDIGRLIDLIQSNKQIANNLIDWLIVKSSFFFRNSLVFDLIIQELLPKILNQAIRSKTDSIRIWSAGCSTGEEPYSIAILVKDYFKQVASSIPIYIFGTDLSESALKQAKKANYIKEKLLDTKLKIVDEYFVQTNKLYQLNESIKTMVDFSKHDLLSNTEFLPTASVFGSFDLVLCRNVLIYYPLSKQEVILERLIGSLSKNGYLILGEAESITAEHCDQLATLYPRAKIYQKIKQNYPLGNR